MRTYLKCLAAAGVLMQLGLVAAAQNDTPKDRKVCAVTASKSGRTFRGLTAISMTCEEANTVLQRALTLGSGRVNGYHCIERPSDSGGSISCMSTTSNKSMSSAWSTAAQSR